MFFISAAINDCLSIGGIQDIQVRLFHRLSAKPIVVTSKTKTEKHDLVRGWGLNSLDVGSMSVSGGFEIWEREAKSFEEYLVGRNQANFKPKGCYLYSVFLFVQCHSLVHNIE